MIEEKFISFETAKMLNESGIGFHSIYDPFREHYYNEHGVLDGDVTEDVRRLVHKEKTLAIPAYQQSIIAQIFRKVYGVHIEIGISLFGWEYTLVRCNESDDRIGSILSPTSISFSSYEEALEKGIQEELKQIIAIKKEEQK